MLIARATTGTGDDLLILGLSTENRRRLDEGHSIDLTTRTHGEAIPKTLHLLIFAGDTEDSMQAQLQGLMGPDTVIEDRRGARR
jgi:hypothetical protein